MIWRSTLSLLGLSYFSLADSFNPYWYLQHHIVMTVDLTANSFGVVQWDTDISNGCVGNGGKSSVPALDIGEEDNRVAYNGANGHNWSLYIDYFVDWGHHRRRLISVPHRGSGNRRHYNLAILAAVYDQYGHLWNNGTTSILRHVLVEAVWNNSGAVAVYTNPL